VELPAAATGMRRNEHEQAAQQRAGQEGRDAPPLPWSGSRCHGYDPSVTRHPAPFVSLSRDVREALERTRPVVALETTYVAHGFPHPDGMETAAEAQAAVRDAGAVPATIALADGEILVGTDSDLLERMGTQDARKVGPRDLAACLADRALGATTVAGTLAVARLCGIRFAATGGIGGVHRDAEHSFDVSADLAELGRAQVCLVASGAKSLLDVPKTLEVLETLGVPVVGYGSSTLPLFYCRESGYDVPARVDTPEQAAYLCAVHWDLDRSTAVLIANPPPAASALEPEEAAGLIEVALAEAVTAGVRGQDVTPFVLERVHAASGGRTQRVNRDLIVANARLAAEIAVATGRRSG
jgi:pseudouridine-5'-phosphate glycosidase